MIIFLFFIPFLIHSAENLNKFLIGSRIDSELTQSNILYNRPSQNNASVKTPNGFAVQKILNREASIFFNTNDQIESFWNQYTGQKLRGISHDLSQKMKETNELINSKNYANFNNKYNKELIKIFQDISNTKNINPQKNTAFQSSLETLNSKVRQELLLERKSTIRQCSFHITTNQQKIDNEVTCTRYDNLGDHKYRSNKEQEIALLRKKIIKEETIFFGNIQSILNYINDINLDVIDIRLWPQVKTRLVKMVGTLNLCPPYKDRFQLFSSDDKLIQSLLQILEDIANETLTDEKEFDRRAKNFYEDIDRAESEKNEPQIDIPLIKTDTDAPEQVERSDQKINNPSEKTPPNTDSEKHQTVTNASIDTREKSKQIVDNSKEDQPDEKNNVTPPPLSDENKVVSQINAKNPIKQPDPKENLKQKPANQKKPLLSFKSGLKIALAGVLCAFMIHAYFHNLFGLQTLLKKR